MNKYKRDDLKSWKPNHAEFEPVREDFKSISYLLGNSDDTPPEKHRFICWGPDSTVDMRLKTSITIANRIINNLLQTQKNETNQDN